MRRSKTTTNEIIRLLQKENKQLVQERNSLLAKLSEIERYKQDYEALIKETKLLKEQYENGIAKTENMFREYTERLKELINRQK